MSILQKTKVIPNYPDKKQRQAVTLDKSYETERLMYNAF
jgi:hypothetical protein